MATFKSYKEAVIKNGKTNAVYTDGVRFYTDDPEMAYQGITPCNPADYLESLESFLASGKLLERGDSYVGLNGLVQCVTHPETANTTIPSDNLRFVLQATADQVEPLEEKEEFARLAREHDNETKKIYRDSHKQPFVIPGRIKSIEEAFDTTPQQYESLSSSDKPNNQDIAVLEEIIRLKEAECEKLFDDKLALLDEIAWLHNKLISEGRRYGASMKREFIAKMIKDMGGDHGSK